MRLKVSGSSCSTGSDSGSTFRAPCQGSLRARSSRKYGAHPAVLRDDFAARARYRHRQCLRRATRPTSTRWATPQATDSGCTESCASGLSASSAGANSSSSDSANRNGNACTRLVDRAGGSSRRSPSRSKVPRRPRTRACRPIPLAPRSTRSSSGLTAARRPRECLLRVGARRNPRCRAWWRAGSYERPGLPALPHDAAPLAPLRPGW